MSLLLPVSGTTRSAPHEAEGRVVPSGLHRTRVSEMRSAATRRAVLRAVIPGAGRRDDHTHAERYGHMPGSLGTG